MNDEIGISAKASSHIQALTLLREIVGNNQPALPQQKGPI